jgi:hypothetical protein
MSTIIRRFSRSIDYIKESRAPLNTDGARPQSGLFEKEVTELFDSLTNPAFTLTDLVSEPPLTVKRVRY